MKVSYNKSKLLFICIIGVLNVISAFSVDKTAYNVKDYGAVGDGKTLDHMAINKTIETAANAGGGTVFLPSGTYLSGSIRLKSNINLYLDAGCVILGAPQDIGAYDPQEPFEGRPYQDNGHTYFHNSLIWGVGLKNVSITGYGMINGGGLVDNRGEEGKGSKAIALKLCTNVQIRNITIYHGGHFAIIVTGCNIVTLDNIIIDTNRDGIDIDCCTNTVVSNCIVNSPEDDAICIKSSYALGKKVVTENLTITNCQVSGFLEGTLLDGRMLPSTTVSGRNGRIKFGTESNGGFRNCVVTNCVFRACRGIALEVVDGGIMENISISNLTMFDVDDYPIYITLGVRNNDPGTNHIPVGRRISISNIEAHVNDTLSGIHITGTPEFLLEDISLRNIRVVYIGGGTRKLAQMPFPELGNGYPEIFFLYAATPSYGVFARHVKNLQLDNVSVSFEKEDFRPAMICINVDGLEIENFKAKVAEGVPVARFENVKNIKVIRSPLIEEILKNNRKQKNK